MTFLSKVIKIFIFSGVFLSAYAADLTVYYKQNKLPNVTRADGEKLDQFYAQLQLPADVDWNNSLLTNSKLQTQFELNTIYLQNQLKTLENRWLRQDKIELVQSIRQLEHEVFELKVVGRIPAKLDQDFIRLHTKYNRPLVGHYTLYVGSHFNNIHLLGLMNGHSEVKLESGWSVEQYVADAHYLSGAEQSYGYLILGNGDWQRVPLAYWNHKHIEPSDGATLFIGFSSDVLPDDMQDINDHIAAYIANRIPQ